MNYKKEVWTTFQIEATHNWPECPFEEVDFLRVPHRHMFHVKAYKEVTHNDRDVEFILLQRKLIHYFYNTYYNAVKNIHQFGHKSCEMIAQELIEKFNLSCCEVSEDLENGAVVTPVAETDQEIYHRIATDDSISPYSKVPSYFKQELYDELIENLAAPHLDLGPDLGSDQPLIDAAVAKFNANLEKECDVCGSTDPDSGCKTC